MRKEVSADALRYDDRGLVPAVVQDVADGTVLMVGFMNSEAVSRTLSSGDVWFWSRSRSALWHKGETSGNYLRVIEVAADCDNDTVLIQVRPEGPTCHTGERSCFNATLGAANAGYGGSTSGQLSVDGLWAIIAQRAAEPEQGSYTNHLLSAGVDRIGRKIGEEAAETIIAAKNHTPDELTAEVSDLLYHMLVLMAAEGVALTDVYAELGRRHGAPRRYVEQAQES